MQMDYTSQENMNLNCCYVNGRMTDSEEKKQPLVVIDYVAHYLTLNMTLT